MSQAKNEPINRNPKNNEELSDEQLKNVAGGVRPPSGDANPSDLSNSTVDTSEIIDPHAK